MSFVAHRHLTFDGARPMRLITPAITTGARMRYDATYARMRGQIDALRQVLKFRLAERRLVGLRRLLRDQTVTAL